MDYQCHLPPPPLPDRVPVERYRVGLVSNFPVLRLRSLPTSKEVYSKNFSPIKMIFGSKFCPRGGANINVLCMETPGGGGGAWCITAANKQCTWDIWIYSSSYLPRLAIIT